MELFSKLFNRFISESTFDEKLFCWDADTRYLRKILDIKWRRLSKGDYERFGNSERFIREVNILEILFILQHKYGMKCSREVIFYALLLNGKSNMLIAHQLYIEGNCEMIKN